VTYRYRLAFTDVDYARLVFSGEYYRWAERAFETWQYESGLPWHVMIDELGLDLASVETRCHYVAPLGFEDEFDVSVGLRDLDEHGFVSDFEIARADDGRLTAHGYLVRRFLHAPPPAAALAVFRAMAERTSVERYDDRVERLERLRRERRAARSAWTV